MKKDKRQAESTPPQVANKNHSNAATSNAIKNSISATPLAAIKHSKVATVTGKKGGEEGHAHTLGPTSGTSPPVNFGGRGAQLI